MIRMHGTWVSRISTYCIDLVAVVRDRNAMGLHRWSEGVVEGYINIYT